MPEAESSIALESSLSNNEEINAEDVVNPWTVSAASKKGVDYDKLIGEIFLRLL